MSDKRFTFINEDYEINIIDNVDGRWYDLDGDENAEELVKLLNVMNDTLIDLVNKRVVNDMGLLPSQEYDMVLLAFCDYLGADVRRLIAIECDDYVEMVHEYLGKCDNGELDVYGNGE